MTMFHGALGAPADPAGPKVPPSDLNDKENDGPVRSAASVCATTEVLAGAIEARTHGSGGDVRLVQRHAVALARRAGLDEADVEAVGIAALLHDVGALVVPPHILGKAGPLTPEEFERVRVHPEAGAALLADVPFPGPVLPIILGHHERWDGRGYPEGLAGESITTGARVLAVVDTYDSLRSPRPYRRPYSAEGARQVLQAEAGKALDPALVALYLDELRLLEPNTEAAGRETTERSSSPFNRIERAQRESAALYDLSRAMSVSLDLQETLAALLPGIQTLVVSDAVVVFLAGDDGLLRCACSAGIDSGRVRVLALDDEQAAPAVAVRTGRSVVNGDPVRELWTPDPQKHALRSSLMAPLSAAGRAFGALAVYSAASMAFAPEQARMLERIAGHASLALANALRFQRAQTDSLTDALTGLPNARFLSMHLAQELARATRTCTELSLLIIDLDDFKRINDTAGHHVGDRALREVARVLRSRVRAYDVCTRYAGDEFVLMLPECGTADVVERVAQIDAAVNQIDVEAGERRIKVRASVGAAVFPGDGRTFETLLASADRQMYGNKERSKRSRRTAVPIGAGTAEPRAVLARGQYRVPPVSYW